MQVLTVTLNPAIDQTIELRNFEKGDLNKVVGTHKDPGGKGVNVSKTIKALGGQTLALAISAGISGDFLENSLRAQNIPIITVPVAGETRTNLKVIDLETGQLTEINEPGPWIDIETQRKFLETFKNQLTTTAVVVLSGSLPPGLDGGFYVELMQLAKTAGVPVILDADGPAFKAGLAGMPTAIKPNISELSRYFSRAVESEEDILEAITHFTALGIEHVFVSLGANGAYYGNFNGCYRLEPLQVEAHSPVGAGDAFIGAVSYALAHHFSTENMLKLATATSAGAVATIGTKSPERAWIEQHIDKVVVKPLTTICIKQSPKS